ncbi:MAG: hypothetical protein KGL39_35305 [Patescibacteria group bacterium]|nr:hypothetical protein [Patescibacteria group bacterium]
MTEEEIIKALDLYFNREEPPKFVNISRVPLICQNITQIYEKLKGIEEGIKAQETDHEIRIRSLERRQWKWMGGAGVIGAILAALWEFIVNQTYKH